MPTSLPISLASRELKLSVEDGLVLSVSDGDTEYPIPAEEGVKVLADDLPDRLDTQDFVVATRSITQNGRQVRFGLSVEDSAVDKPYMDVEMAATHFGYVNGNYCVYLASAGKKSTGSWTRPYGKPYLTNHDMHSDPLGRVMQAKFVATGQTETEDGQVFKTGYHLLTTRVADEKEKERILSGQSLTLSISARPDDTVECSICGQDLTDSRKARPYLLTSEPKGDWLTSPAPGFLGEIGITMGELFDYKVDGEGKDAQHWCSCPHIKGIEAPLGGKDTLTTVWMYHGLVYKEVSRVNYPADVNEKTGEVARIVRVISGAENPDHLQGPEDGRDWVPADLDAVLASDGHIVLNDTEEALSVLDSIQDPTSEEFLRAYAEQGGTFMTAKSAEETQVEDAVEVKTENPLAMSPNQFGSWLRALDASDVEKRGLDALYVRRNLS